MTPDNLIGVIDLRHGAPVHAVAGERQRYLPRHENGHPLAATDVIVRYRRNGIRRFYVADLDGIVEGKPCWDRLTDLATDLAAGEQLLIDAGWRGSESESELWPIRQMIAKRPDQVSFIAAAESAVTSESPSRLAAVAGVHRVWLGFDYRDGEWLGQNGVEATWVTSAKGLAYAGIVVLDLAAIGISGGPSTGQIVRRLKNSLPKVGVVTGGGIRDEADVEGLIAAGASGCLVATALMDT